MRASLARLAFTIAAAAALPAAAQAPSQNRGDSPGGATLLKPPITGEQVYHQVCQACHMANAGGGKGAGVIPALADNPRLAQAAYPITFIVKGHGAMPYFTDLLAPAQIANVTTYIRTHFGNTYPAPVTEAQVKAIEGPSAKP